MRELATWNVVAILFIQIVKCTILINVTNHGFIIVQGMHFTDLDGIKLVDVYYTACHVWCHVVYVFVSEEYCHYRGTPINKASH